MNGFRNGTFQILVATDIAARGIDVSQVSHVINYDIPNTTDAYIHRIGRTGRAARSGDAYTLVDNEDMDMVRSIERVLNGPIERRSVANFDYTAAAPRRELSSPARRVMHRRASQAWPITQADREALSGRRLRIQINHYEIQVKRAVFGLMESLPDYTIRRMFLR
jgi:ATP-dependent RNA helicase RhlE